MAKHTNASFSSFSSSLNLGGGKLSHDTSQTQSGSVAGRCDVQNFMYFK